MKSEISLYCKVTFFKVKDGHRWTLNLAEIRFKKKKTVYQKRNCIENYYCFINNIILDRQIYLVTTQNMH